jgi:butyrate kinase
MKILVLNPGATSTKFGVFEDDKCLFKKTISHSVQDLKQFARVFDQYPYRMKLIMKELEQQEMVLRDFSAVVARGGLLKPIAGGTYVVNEKMLHDLEKAERGEHASNLGAAIAYDIASGLGIPAFIVDPVAVDEMEPVARISGFPEIERVSLFHALNHKAVARKVAAKLGKKYESANFVVAHLGTGISVAAHRKGWVIDVNDCKDEGAFSLDRCGGIPTHQLVKLCYSGKYTFEQMKQNIMPHGGMYAYLGTRDMREIEQMAISGNEKAALLIEALAYQVAKDIGSQAAVLCGRVDVIILTGGMAYSEVIVDKISKRVSFIAPVIVIPGEEELEALAMGGLRVLRKECKACIYE